MADSVVVFDGVWKKFRRGERHDSLRDLIPALFKRAVGARSVQELREQEFWALEDVSFEVNRGEALGIIGPNGAGKSTTLKLLTKILRPTQGRCEVRGRTGALIEVAAGFHPDLTGRENVFLQGAIMGMRRAEIARKFDEIVAFAGMAEFIDTPVKRYSSGMNAKLGFSIAANLEPDSLIIDEVLSVGDMAFQQRCIERMTAFKKQGVAIVFVSHNLQAVGALCDTALYLQRQAKCLGPTAEVIDQYVRSSNSAATIDTSTEVAISAAALLGNTEGRPTYAPGEDVTLRVNYVAGQAISDLTFGIVVYRSHDRLRVYDANIHGDEIGVRSVAAGDSLVVDFSFKTHLARAQFDIECHVFHNPTYRFLSRLAPAAMFSVLEHRTHSGVADLDLRAVLRYHGSEGDARIAVHQKVAAASLDLWR